eukprot:c21225_g1_i2 orf=48-389(+)
MVAGARLIPILLCGCQANEVSEDHPGCGNASHVSSHPLHFPLKSQRTQRASVATLREALTNCRTCLQNSDTGPKTMKKAGSRSSLSQEYIVQGLLIDNLGGWCISKVAYALFE